MKSLSCLALCVFAFPAPNVDAASILVTTTADTIATDGDCSLREAMLASTNNSAPGADCTAGDPGATDRIRFDNSVFSGSSATFNLAPGAGPLAAGGGSITLDVPSDKRITIRASVAAAQRLLEVDFGGEPHEFTARRVDWGNGRAAGDGGAVWIGGGGTIEFDDCQFNNNAAGGSGGAIGVGGFASTSLRLDETRFSNNMAGADGGAIGSRGDATTMLEVSGGTFTGNSAPGGRGGAIAVSAVADGTVTQAMIQDSVFEDNEALSSGAFHADSSASPHALVGVQIYNTRFSGNQSLAAGSEGRGGALRIEGSASAVNAGLLVRRSSFIGNHDASTAVARGSGAVYIGAASLLIQNSLFALNSAAGASAAVTINFADDETILRTVLVLGNSFERNMLTGGGDGAADAAQFLLVGSADTSAWSVRLLGNLFHSDAATEADALDCRVIDGAFVPIVVHAGYNVGNRAECAFGSDSVMADPQVELVPVEDPVHAASLYPSPGSPALDRWPAVFCVSIDDSAITMDLAGNARPVDGDGDGDAHCDAGAFEGTASPDLIFADGFEG